MQLAPVTKSAGAAAPDAPGSRRAVLLEKAKALETAFLSEMLSYAGMGKSDGEFSGGVGEDQYASFLREAQAKDIVAHGGIGLAEHLFQSLVKNDHAPD